MTSKILLNIKYHPGQHLPNCLHWNVSPTRYQGVGAGFLTASNRAGDSYLQAPRCPSSPFPLSPAASLRHPQMSEQHVNSGMFPSNPPSTEEETRRLRGGQLERLALIAKLSSPWPAPDLQLTGSSQHTAELNLTTQWMKKISSGRICVLP